mgnify:FL=1
MKRLMYTLIGSVLFPVIVVCAIVVCIAFIALINQILNDISYLPVDVTLSATAIIVLLITIGGLLGYHYDRY